MSAAALGTIKFISTCPEICQLSTENNSIVVKRILCRVQLSNKRRLPPQRCPVANNYRKRRAYLSKYGMRHIPPAVIAQYRHIFWILYDKETTDDLVTFLRTYGRTDETLTQVV